MRRLSWTLLLACLIAACADGGTTTTTASTLPPILSTSAPEGTTSPPSSTALETTTTTSTTLGVVDSSLVMLASGPAARGPVAGVVGVEGFPRAAYVSSDGELRLVICSDMRCEEPVEELPLGNPGEVLDLDLALGTDGAPVVVVNSSDTAGASYYWCADSDCSSVVSVEVVDKDGMAYPKIVVGADGLARLVYLTNTDPMAVKVATCGRDFSVCDGWAIIDVLPSQVFTGAPSVRLDSNDRLFVGYWYSQGDEVQESRVAVCEIPSCSNPTIIAVFQEGVFPQTTPGDAEDEFRVWYQTGSQYLPLESADPSLNYADLWSDYSDFMVVECTTIGCLQPNQVEVGEDWLLAQAAGAFRLFTTTDGTTGAFFNHASRSNPTPQLHVSVCSDHDCTIGKTQTLGIDTVDGRFFDVITATDAAPQVVFRSIDETIHLYNCGTETCSP